MGRRWALRAERAFDGERFLTDGATVVVEGDRIVGVEATGRAVPDDVPVTEVAGTLLPGLVDSHVHLVSAGAFPGTPGSLEWAGTAGPVVRGYLDTAARRSTASSPTACAPRSSQA